jgi:hypothetical protein
MGIRGGFHDSFLDPRPHYCVRAFRQDGHAYKAMHVYSNTESTYNGKAVGAIWEEVWEYVGLGVGV